MSSGCGRASLGTVFAAIGLLLLSGCIQPDPTPTIDPMPTSSPVFESEEEALAAAEAAYTAYLEMSDLISSEGGKDPERIAPFVTEEWLAKEVDAFVQLAEAGRRQVGATSFSTHQLQQVDENGDETAIVAIYVCTDTSATLFLDSSDNDVTPPDRQTLLPLEVTLQASATQVLLDGIEPWAGTPFC